MDSRVRDLKCIMPLANLGSVMKHGILSHDRASRLAHASVAMQPVQDRRDATRVPGGRWLHRYANLYFNARNPMLYKRRPEADELCVLSVSLDVLAIEGTVIADCNAASPMVRFLAPHQWEAVAFDDVLARRWTHPDDPTRERQHRLRMCAEVLVPDRVPPGLVRGAYVKNNAIADRVAAAADGLKTRVVPDMFFS